jgi:hypothetical protein
MAGGVLLRRVLEMRATAPTILVRLIVGGAFVSEVASKLLDPGPLGVGRFAEIGIPWPSASAPFDAMLPAATCLLIAGAGPRSIDGYLGRRRARGD